MIFLVSLSSRHGVHVLLRRKTKLTDQAFSLIFLFYDDRIEVACKNQSNFQITVALKITFRQF